MDSLGAGAELVEALDVVGKRHQPGGDLEAEGGRQRVLQVGAAGHDGVAVGVGSGCQGGGDGDEFGADEVQAVAELQHDGGVHDVLGGGAPMGPAAGFGAGRAGEAADDADDGVADVADAGGEFGGVEIVDTGGGGDGGGGLGGDDAEAGLDAGEGGFDVEHALEEGALVPDRAHGVAAVRGCRRPGCRWG